MALLDVRKRQAIQEVVDRWRERCLLDEGSLLFGDEQVWTPENLALLYHNPVIYCADIGSHARDAEVHLGSVQTYGLRPRSAAKSAHVRIR
jgi:hypothetical protein